MSKHIYRTEKSQIKYQSHYNKLIAKAQSRNLKTRKEAKEIFGYVEEHHIIPTSLGGLNVPSNRVFLTAREHFVAHQFLVFVYPGNFKMTMAVNMMMRTRNEIKINGRKYEWLRILNSEVRRSRNKDNDESIARAAEKQKLRNKETCSGCRSQSEKISKLNNDQFELLLELKQLGMSNKEVAEELTSRLSINVSTVYVRNYYHNIFPELKRKKKEPLEKIVKPPRKGRTKETCPGVYASASKQIGRTKENHAGVALRSANVAGRNKHNHPGVASSAESKNRLSLSLRTELFERHIQGESTKDLFAEIEPLQISKVTYKYLLYLFRRMKKEMPLQ